MRCHRRSARTVYRRQVPNGWRKSPITRTPTPSRSINERAGGGQSKLGLTLHAVPRQANSAGGSETLNLLKQIGCVSGGNGEIRAAKAPKDREIYSNDLTVSIKEGPT